ncbi:MAG TPA: ribbon-helix-helix domain-containing protein [Thermoanaerobaculia bacterium]|nr:ribbon-helix-helix domain-containing protein [Thermoanaerobaculia bacterium]
MSTVKVAITLEETLLRELDRLVEERQFPNRSQAVQIAVREKIDRLSRSRLARECAKLDPDFEQKMAEEGMERDAAEWPPY